MKRKILLMYLILVLTLLGCNEGTELENRSNNNVNESSVIKQNDNTDNKKEVEETNLNTNIDTNEKSDWKFSEEDLSVDGKSILNTPYEELLENLGLPQNTRILKVRPPATEEGVYAYFFVAEYEGLEIEFDLGFNETTEPSNLDKSFRFDILGENVTLDFGLSVGMTMDELKKNFGDIKKYNIRTTERTSNLDRQDIFKINDINHILSIYKPDDIYKEYTEAMIVYADYTKWEDPISMAMVLLIKEDKVDRIVFGYPTSS